MTIDGAEDAFTADHIVPEFLGGRKTIQACRGCNSSFGHTFEGRASKALSRIYIYLAHWGTPLPEMNQRWSSAHHAEGIDIDLTVGPLGLTGSSSQPIIKRDDAGNITEVLFPEGKGLAQFLEKMKRRKPELAWEPIETRLSTDLHGLRLRFDFGFDLQQ